MKILLISMISMTSCWASAQLSTETIDFAHSEIIAKSKLLLSNTNYRVSFYSFAPYYVHFANGSGNCLLPQGSGIQLTEVLNEQTNETVVLVYNSPSKFTYACRTDDRVVISINALIQMYVDKINVETHPELLPKQ
jgi:hypothetical protein